MPRYQRQWIEHSFRCKVWFGFFLVCVAVIFFPPWIISGDESYPTPFRIGWLTRWNLHFWAYQPLGVMHVMDNTGYCREILVREYKHLNYYLLAFEVVSLGVLAQILRRVIHWHAKSTASKLSRLR